MMNNDLMLNGANATEAEKSSQSSPQKNPNIGQYASYLFLCILSEILRDEK